MKKSVLLSRILNILGYCQLLRQWTRLSLQHRISVPISACCQQVNAIPQRSLASLSCHSKRVTPFRQYCTSVEEFSEEDIEEVIPSVPLTREKLNIKPKFRTENDDPLKQTIEHEGLYYRIPRNEYEKYIEKGQWPRYKKQVQTFQECAIMVRRPALEVIDYIENADLHYPPLRILFYGKNGAGKSLSLAHIVHRCARDGWITIHLPDVLELVRYRKTKDREYSMSSYKEGIYDYTDDAVEWLKYFVRQNEHLLQGIKTTKEYVWSQREKSNVGEDLLDIIEFGTNRKKYASDCVGITFREIKLQAQEKNLKVLVAVDGVNGFWKNTSIRDNNKKVVNAQKVSFFQHFQKLFEPDWTHGVCVGTVCPAIDAVDIADLDKDEVPHTPRYLLKRKGFEMMAPFIPVLVPEYSSKEAHNCIDYYIERKWIIKPRGLTEEGKKELMMLSNNNPLQLMNVSSWW